MELNPLGLKFAIIDRAFKKNLDEYARTLGLTSVQLRVLAEIKHIEENSPDVEINQKNLEIVEKVSHPTMSAIVSQLEKKGFIVCSVSSIDRRFKSIKSTERSENLNQMLIEHDLEVFKKLCAGMSNEDEKELLKYIDIMLNNLN